MSYYDNEPFVVNFNRTLLQRVSNEVELLYLRFYHKQAYSCHGNEVMYVKTFSTFQRWQISTM